MKKLGVAFSCCVCVCVKNIAIAEIGIHFAICKVRSDNLNPVAICIY